MFPVVAGFKFTPIGATIRMTHTEAAHFHFLPFLPAVVATSPAYFLPSNAPLIVMPIADDLALKFLSE